MHKRLIVPVLVLGGLLTAWPAASADQGITVSDNRATLQFPESITFSIELESDAEIDDVVLEYGVDQMTCGTVVAKAFPEFTPSGYVEAEWTWEMKQTGSEPPGAQMWWRWRASDADGNELLTDRRTVTWIDDEHPWQAINGEWIRLHWYGGSEAFGRELHDAATAALARLGQNIGLRPDGPADIYIYATSEDMRDAVFYEPGWSGGQAYPAYNIIIIGVTAASIEWGKSTEAHELTHVLEGRYTFSCLGSLPTWLVEGLAVYGEGGLAEYEQGQIDAAIADDSLLSVRALGGRFSEIRETADLSYAQSYSLVDFLLAEYDQQQLLDLLGALRDGAAIDAALEDTYGFDSDGLEDAWRAAIGAQPRVAGEATPTPTPTPTPVPTLAPISGIPIAAATEQDVESPDETEADIPETDTAEEEGDEPTAAPDETWFSSLPDWVLPALIAVTAIICVAGIVAVVSVVAMLRRRRRNS